MMLSHVKTCFLFVLATVCFVQANVMIIAHRGASGYLPEHTLESKVAAFVMNSDYIESDIALSKDDIPIVIHDIHLDTVTNVAEVFGRERARNDSRYYAIDFTYDEIKKLNVTERFDIQSGQAVYANRFPQWKSHFHLHSLSEEIELIQGMQKSMAWREIGIYVEIKQPYFHRQNGKSNMSSIVLNILQGYGYAKESDMAIIQCFDPFELMKIRFELKSDLTLVQLLQSAEYSVYEPYIDYGYWNSAAGLKNISSFAQGIGPEKDQLTLLDLNNKFVGPSDMLINAKNTGLFIHPYTFRADKLPLYAKSFDELLSIFIDFLKVDGLFTDFPNMAIKYTKNAQNSLQISKALITCIILVLCGIF